MRHPLLSLALLAMLTACGGGGGNQASADPAASPAAVLQVQAMPSAIETATSTTSAVAAKAVDLTDAIAILKMIVGLDVNTGGAALTAYQAYAADVDANGKVELSDAISVLKRIVGLETASANWMFFNGTPTVTDKLNPGLPPSVSAAVSSTSNVSMTAVLRGDVVSSSAYTYSWALTKPAGSSASLVSTTAANPSFKADVAGEYVATMTITDGSSNVATSSVTVTACSASSNSSSPFSGCTSTGGDTSTAGNSISGIVAVGAPIANAAMTLVCGNGDTQSTTADVNGAYSFTALSSCTAPYVVKANGFVGGTQESFVSVLPKSVTGAVKLNVTPITNAIAATLAPNGDPMNLVTNIATEKNQITEAAVNARATALKNSLSGALSSAGVSADFDLMQTPFTADGKGFDKVLDNIKVDVKSSGITLTNSAGSVVDDVGNRTTSSVGDFSASTISISNATNFSSALPSLPSAILDHSIVDIFQTQLNNCFATPSASRGTIGSLGTNCQVFQIASDYLNDGRNATQEFGGRLSSATYDNAKFGRPEVIRFLSTSATDTRAIVSISLLRSDYVPEIIQTVVEQSSATGGVLKLRGNQRPFLIDLSGSVIKLSRIVQRNSTTAAKSTFYMTGLNIFLDYKIGCAGSNVPGCTGTSSKGKISHVKVTGPFLPTTGLFLRNNGSGGCDQYFTIWRSNSTTPNNCSAIFQLSSRAATTSDTDNYNSLFGNPTSPNFADAKVSDADILALNPGALYKFEVYGTSDGCNGACPNYVFEQRLRSRPYTMGSVANLSGEVDRIKWNDSLQASSIDSITPATGASPATLASLNIAYIRNLNAAPPFKTFIQTRTTSGGSIQSDSLLLPISPGYVSGSTVSVNLTNSGTPWNNPKTTTNSLDTYNQIELVSRNRFGTILDRVWRY